MKAIATLIFVLFIGVVTQAQNATENVKVDAVEMGIATETALDKTFSKNTTEVARLYKRTHTRVKKELTFTTKANHAKMA